MDIFVLEDDIPQQFRIERAIEIIMSNHKWDYGRLEIFDNPQDLLQATVRKMESHLFFLDLEIKGEEQKGIDVAKTIRETDESAIIVFVTTHSEFMLLTYQSLVGAMDFVDKTLPEEEFNKRLEICLGEAVKRLSAGGEQKTYLLETSKARVRVPYNDILYFETSPAIHRIILHTKNERIEFYATMSEVEKSDNRLFKCHRSFVINLDNVERFDKLGKIVYFETGATCPVARNKVSQLTERMR